MAYNSFAQAASIAKLSKETAISRTNSAITSKVPSVSDVLGGIRGAQAGTELAFNQATGIDKLVSFIASNVAQVPTPQSVLDTQLQAIEVKARADISQAVTRINELKRSYQSTPALQTPAEADEEHGVVTGGASPEKLSDLFAQNASDQDKQLMVDMLQTKIHNVQYLSKIPFGPSYNHA
jgi:hypothetical protein